MILWRYKFSLLYVMLIPLVNWAFAHSPFYTLPDGGSWSPFSIVVGCILIARDFSQRELGHYVFVPLIIGVILSYFLAAPAIALASAAAFLVSEAVDWVVYSYAKRPLSERVLISSFVGVPVDTVIFLSGANIALPGIFSFWTLISMLVSKMTGAFIVFAVLKHRERKAL